MSTYVCLWQHLDESEIDLLCSTQMGWYDFIENGEYTEDQRFRFERVGHGPDPTEKRWEDAAACWVTGEANALLYLTYVRSQGGEAVLLLDLGSLPDEPPNYPGGVQVEYVVVALGFYGHEDMLATVGKSNRESTDRKRAGRVSDDPNVRMVWQAWEEVRAPWTERFQVVADVYGMDVEAVARIILPDERFERWVAGGTQHPRHAEIWEAWNDLGTDDTKLLGKSQSPVKRIARDLGLSNREVADTLFPEPEFGWDEDDEPDLPEDDA